MTHFQLYPHCYLVVGDAGDAIFDIFQERVFWLNSPVDRKALRALEAGKSLEAVGREVGRDDGRIQAIVEFLESLDYGSRRAGAFYPEKFRPVVLPGQEETFFLQRALRRVVVEISSQCSLACRICGFRDGWATSLCACGVWQCAGRDASFDASRLVSDLATVGCGELHIQGGDPFLTPDPLHALVAEARRNDLSVSVQTPGACLTAQDWRFVRQMGLKLVVPVFGADEDAHDSATGVPGSFAKLTHLLRECRRDRSVSLSANVILSTRSLPNRSAVRDWLRANGVEQIADHAYLPLDDCAAGSGEGLLAGLFKRKPADFRVSADTFLRLARGHECWQDELAVTLTGDVLPCIAARDHVVGNLVGESLLDILRAKRHFPFREGGRDAATPCSGCEFRYGCTACSLVTERIVGKWQGRAWDCTYDPALGEWGRPPFLHPPPRQR